MTKAKSKLGDNFRRLSNIAKGNASTLAYELRKSLAEVRPALDAAVPASQPVQELP